MDSVQIYIGENLMFEGQVSRVTGEDVSTLEDEIAELKLQLRVSNASGAGLQRQITELKAQNTKLSLENERFRRLYDTIRNNMTTTLSTIDRP